MVKITDVARAAGVSTATVSRVLNQPDMVVRDKREKVLAAVRALNYAPNSLAHGLRAGQVRTVTLLVGDISQPFHGALAKSMDREGQRLGYRVLLRDLDRREDRTIAALNQLRTSESYGAVLATATDLDTPPVRAAVAAARTRGVVLVTSSQQIPGGQIPAILPQYRSISRLAVDHLVEAGAGPVILIGGTMSSPLSRERMAGFAEACEATGRQDSLELALDGDFSVGTAFDRLQALFDRHLGRRFGPGVARFGVIAVNMPMAIGAMQAAALRGLRIPEDMMLICCEDLPLAAAWRPALTTVGIDFDVLAQAAFAALVAGDAAAPVSFVPHRLQARRSTGH